MIHIVLPGGPSHIDTFDPKPEAPDEFRGPTETIKTKGADYHAHIQAYRASLEALAEAGISSVCYNFMPVLDWTRTHLRWPLPNGGMAMRFDLTAFASFDL